jgi:gamma-glutamylcyclotransferase (GGCT)/AIG2-like uncharacterized protein YtfP
MKLFVYGLLKRGLPLDLTKHGGKFLGEGWIKGAKLYKVGAGGVGLRFVDDPLEVGHGELFEIAPELLPWLDCIEDEGNVYTRRKCEVHFGWSVVQSVHVYEHTYFHDWKYKTMETFKGGIFK